jgi:hypothetical protein
MFRASAIAAFALSAVMLAARAEPVGQQGLVVKAGLFDFLFGGGRDDRPEPVPRPDPVPGWGGAYRTVCVRLCDGFPVPISAATYRDRFAGDAKRCEQTCPGSKLFAYSSSGQQIDQAVDLEGKRYADLPNAFKHRTEYVANCTCRGNPWDAEALARHRAYAERQKPQQSKIADTGKSRDAGARPRQTRADTTTQSQREVYPRSRHAAGRDRGD